MRKLIAIFVTLISLTGSAQFPIPSSLGFNKPQSAAPASFILDTYPMGAGSAAYGLIKLSSSYTGPLIRVRRSSDNTEQDIGESGGVLDETALLAFVGVGNGSVVTWYDQSGNGIDATIASNFPIIVSGGVVEEVNGMPTLDMGTNLQARYLNIPTGFLNGATSLSYFQVAEITAFGGSNAGVFGPSNTGGVGFEVLQHDVISRPSLLRFNLTARNNDGSAPYQLWDNATQSLTSIFGNSTDVTVYKNSSAVTLTSSAAMPALNFNGVYGIGQYNSASNVMYGKIQLLLIYNTNETANRTAIETYINSIYSIY